MPSASELLRSRLADVGGLVPGESSFGPGDAYWVGGTEVAHFDADDVLDVRLTRAVIRDRRAELRADPRVVLRRSSSADWVEVSVRSQDDVELAVALVEAAVAAHLPPDGVLPEPPPARAALARRRRLHRPPGG